MPRPRLPVDRPRSPRPITLTVALPLEMAARLDSYADRVGRTRSDLVRHALRVMLASAPAAEC